MHKLVSMRYLPTYAKDAIKLESDTLHANIKHRMKRSTAPTTY